MGVLETLGLRTPVITEALTTDPRLEEALATVATLEYRLEESLTALQREDRGWLSLDGSTEIEPAHDQLVREANLVRASSGMNPLMVRAKAVRGAYVWGSGCTVAARSAGTDGTQDVQALVTEFYEDTGNQKAVFGDQARESLENDLFDDGNVFIAHWLDPLTGGVKVRTLPFDEVTDTLSAPGDRSTTHYYLRQWTEQLTSETSPRTMKAWYPDLDYDPRTKVKNIRGVPVLWPGESTPGYGGGAAVYHVKVNPVGRSKKWGRGDGYAARAWAFAYKGFLEDCRALYNALAKIAHVMSGTKDKTQMARATQQAQQGPAGGMLYGNDLDVKTPNYSGIDPNNGRPFAAMVASAVGLAVTILTSDPGQSGARAVAETLDKPQRLLFEARQRVWGEFIKASIGYRIKQAVKAPRGELKGSGPENGLKREGDRTVVVFRDKTDATIQVDFPPIEDANMTALVEAVEKADSTGKMPPLEVLRLLLRAFEVDGADEILEKYTDEDGEFINPNQAAADAAGSAAAHALRNGGNPADVL